METNAWQTVYRDHVQYIQETELGGRVPVTGLDRKTDEQKALRIMGLQPLFQEGKVFFLANGRGVDKAKEQLIRFSKKMIKRMRVDIVDALSDARLHTWCPPRPAAAAPWSISQHWATVRRRGGTRISNYDLPAPGRH